MVPMLLTPQRWHLRRSSWEMAGYKGRTMTLKTGYDVGKIVIDGCGQIAESETLRK
jgi:hypothetical protein